MKRRRAIIIVIDACGIGELPDAEAYGDIGAATLPNVADAVGGLTLPHCRRLGLGNIADIAGVIPIDIPAGGFGRMAEVSPGKDSTTGHWELGGVILQQPLPVYPEGFPDELVREFERRAGVKTIGNIPASGTEIIKELGPEHLRTGAVILYTSADSVFQLAAHNEVLAEPELYEICRIARELLTGEHAVARVIARPFVGKPGEFTRTAGRKDFSLPPPGPVMMEHLEQNGYHTLAVGKISDLYLGRGIAHSVKAAGNDAVMAEVLAAVVEDSTHSLIYANCVDFDMLWGHRNDERNFAAALESFDHQLGRLMGVLQDDDILFIVADHGCDPTLKDSTDHTREYVPLLVYGAGVRTNVDLGTRASFADLSATVLGLFDVAVEQPGTSFATDILK